ncbi:DUF47 domain-containing protein [Halapricum hydrolyticum]|uniref:DUF47 family protein n=1 Tax=Halapricum hydrolyticum TaxID=2979991 RepID=A0AAE3ID21_9EURY|nr:DUF47 family protein [Halapricum hydrolyticum]MCU4717243.1 DUF47 family protein [Halapricum hydrolyticum]MCU4726170.1 DUF47 family protein [Halapricum hydrolyticum]
MTAGASFSQQLESHTDAYLDCFKACIDLLPELLDQYAAGEDYSATIEEIEDLESECDDRNLQIVALITNADPIDMGKLNTRINYNQSALVEFYRTIDVVVNVTERIAHELDMMQPPHDNACFEGLREMATEVADTTELLEEVIERFVHDLSTYEASDSLTDEIQGIRDMESRCDELRNEVITTAFADDSIDQPLMYREFAILFDELANQMEDITEEIIIVASNAPGIVAEEGPEDQ